MTYRCGTTDHNSDPALVILSSTSRGLTKLLRLPLHVRSAASNGVNQARLPNSLPTAGMNSQAYSSSVIQCRACLKASTRAYSQRFFSLCVIRPAPNVRSSWHGFPSIARASSRPRRGNVVRLSYSVGSLTRPARSHRVAATRRRADALGGQRGYVGQGRRRLPYPADP